MVCAARTISSKVMFDPVSARTVCSKSSNARSDAVGSSASSSFGPKQRGKLRSAINQHRWGRRRKQFEPPLLLGNQTTEEKVAIGQGERTAFAVTSRTGMGPSTFRPGAEHSVSKSQARATARCDLHGVCESELIISLDIPVESSNPRKKLTVLMSS